MKKIVSFLGIIIFASISVQVQAFQKNGTYDCEYKIDKYTTGECIFITDKTGKINLNICGPNSPAPELLINEGKCTFIPTKQYICQYPKGSCKVKIMIKDGREVSCTGETPDTKAVLEQAKIGKCQPY